MMSSSPQYEVTDEPMKTSAPCSSLDQVSAKHSPNWNCPVKQEKLRTNGYTELVKA